MKKAKLDLNEETRIIEITEEIDYRFRIMEELAAMALENDPWLHPRKELKNIPFIYWDPKNFTNETHEKIEAILIQKENEFEEVFSKHIIEKLNLKLKENEVIWLGDTYKISPEEKEQNITIHYEIEICEETDAKKYNEDYIKKLVEKHSEDINALINKYQNVRDAEISLTILGDEDTNIIFGIEIYVMLKLDADNAESIANLNIGFIPTDEDEYEEAILLSMDIPEVKNFSVEHILSNIEDILKETA